MRLTSAQANKLLKKLKDDLSSVKANEANCELFVAATTENVDDVRPAYDFIQTQQTIEEIEKQIRKLKHSINQFNVSTTIPELDMTIDEVLIYIPQLTHKKEKLYRMANRLPKARVSLTLNKNFLDYEYVNYDVEEAKKAYERVSESLTEAQVALDTINNTLEFEVDY